MGGTIGQEYIHFLIIAQGSANEVDHWLNTAFELWIGKLGKLRQILALNTESPQDAVGNHYFSAQPKRQVYP